MSVDLKTAKELIGKCEKILKKAHKLADKNESVNNRLGLPVGENGVIVHDGTQYVGTLGSFSATIDSLKESVKAFKEKVPGASEYAFEYLMKDAKYYFGVIEEVVNEFK